MHHFKRRNFYSFGLLIVLFAYVTSSSCISIKKEIYCKDLPDSVNNPYVMNQVTPFVDPKIESNDILSVTVQTIAGASNTSNSGSSGNGTQSSTSGLNGYLVDKNGYIELVLLGFVKVGGLTTAEAREYLKQKAKEFYKDPVVNVKITNFDITMLGNIGRTGPIRIENEKTSIIDAIGLAGDLPLTAKRNNVLLIRTEGDQKKFIRYDLTSKEIFHNPYFYLKQHDIIYVEPRKDVIQNTDTRFSRDVGYFSAIISLISLLVVYRSFK